MEILEVPKVVVSRLCLGNLAVRLRLASVNDVGKLHSVLGKKVSYTPMSETLSGTDLDKENRDIVADNVPVALFSVKLDGESANITDCVCRTTTPKDSRESKEDRCLAGCVGQNASLGDICGGLVERELSEGASAACVDNSLGDTLVVEAVDLQMSAFATHSIRDIIYLLTTEGILQKLRTLLIVADDSEPVIGVVLLHAVVACDPVAPVVDILGVSAQLSDLLVLCASHTFGLFCNVSENF